MDLFISPSKVQGGSRALWSVGVATGKLDTSKVQIVSTLREKVAQCYYQPFHLALLDERGI